VIKVEDLCFNSFIGNIYRLSPGRKVGALFLCCVLVDVKVQELEFI